MKGGVDRGLRPQGVSALSGRLSAVSLFDLCQFLMLNRKTGTLTVRSEGRSSYFTFQDGQLMSALDDAFQNGEGVVLEAVQWPDGEFSFDPGPVPPDRKIHASTETILLEAARRIDEMHAEGAEEEAPSHEQRFRETQARAAGLAEAFRNAVSDTPGQATPDRWKVATLNALSSGSAVCAVFGPEEHVALAGPYLVERIDGVPRTEWWPWIRSLCEGEGPCGRRFGSAPGGLRIRLDGMTLHLRRHGGKESGQVIISRLREGIPDWDELGLEDAIYGQLETTAAGPWVFLDSSQWRRACRRDPFPEGGSGAASSGRNPASGEAGAMHDAGADKRKRATLAALSWAGPALGVAAAWLRRRMENQPDAAWVVERTPFYDWSSLPGSVRTVHPDRLRRPGQLSDLCAAVGANTLVLGRPWNASLAAEATELAAHGVTVVILDCAVDAGDWIRRRRSALTPGSECAVDGIAGVCGLRFVPGENSIHSTLVLPRPADGVTGGS